MHPAMHTMCVCVGIVGDMTSTARGMPTRNLSPQNFCLSNWYLRDVVNETLRTRPSRFSACNIEKLRGRG